MEERSCRFKKSERFAKISFPGMGHVLNKLSNLARASFSLGEPLSVVVIFIIESYSLNFSFKVKKDSRSKYAVREPQLATTLYSKRSTTALSNVTPDH